ncbi:MAG: FG-GAP-like repeat-containing protein, partial [Coriobacteriia bacterium]|nr:FG-GAP-like repeat-containing protein [Coriobacteriia bacterium]
STANWMACVDCHDPHRDPSASPDLLRAYDAVTGRAVRGGADFCWACHGTKKNARVDAAVPGYWTRTGGDKKTGLVGTPHAAISSTSTVGVCGECHASHGSTNKGLVRTQINGKAVTRNHTVFTHDNSACYACHESAVRTYPGKAVFGASIHWPAGCEGCHDPHGKPGIPSLLSASEENGCYSCHDGNENPPCNNCHKAAAGMANPNIEQQMSKTLRTPVEWAAKVQLDDRGVYPYGISLGDLDGDGDLDVACGGYDNLLVWYENTAGDGSAWLEREVYVATSTVLSSRIRDLDGDGDEDIISGTAFGPDYHVRFHENVNGDGTLWSESVVWSGSGGTSAGIWVLDVEDVDNDANLDIVSGGYRVGLHFNENVNGDASAWNTTLISGERATAARIADMDADGDGDVVSGDFNAGGRLYYHENVNGDGSSWGSVQFFDGGAKANWLDIGDLDGDLTPDVVAVFDTSVGDNHRTRAFFNTAGDGSSWTPQTVFDWSRWSGVYYNPTVVRVADATGDGALDVFTSNEAEHVYLSEDRYPDGPEWWTTYVVKGPGYAISTMDVGDVDADGDVDIVYGGRSGPLGPIFYVANEGRSLGASGSHPTNSLSNRHSPGEDSPGVGTGNRHAECADCHDPHSAVYGVHTMGENTAPGVLAGVSGVAVSNLTSWTAPVYAEVDEVSFEYELCFRCHSSYTTGYTGSDKALRFNALNASFHPVEAVGTNVGVWDSAFTLGTPWNPTSGDDPDYGVTSPKMTCTDCHASDRESETRGPHGSEWPTLLRGNFTSIDQADWSQAGVCWVCHDISAYIVQSVTGPSRVNHGHFWNEGAFCTDCHDVHGSNQPHLLSIPYSHTPTGGDLDLTGWTDCSSHHGVSKPYEASY